jgi:hypothetical protein
MIVWLLVVVLLAILILFVVTGAPTSMKRGHVVEWVDERLKSGGWRTAWLPATAPRNLQYCRIPPTTRRRPATAPSVPWYGWSGVMLSRRLRHPPATSSLHARRARIEPDVDARLDTSPPGLAVGVWAMSLL